MSLSPGVRLGAYEIVRLIDVGGMGEVYQARDMRLERVVAIKVLPEQVDDAADHRARLAREARAAAALNHPHICALHDLGEATRPGSSAASGSTIRFLVMEYLEGQTLAARLLRGPLPIDEALRYGMEIADALDHAHQRGLVHRDLKPSNVMLTTAGAKLLDFGLSKPHHTLDVPALATVAAADLELTAPGLLVGTFPYMAPECLDGGEADVRSDVFALGALVYEMVAGRRPFVERTAATLIGAILHADPPPVSSLRAMTPPPLDHLVGRCLAKDPGSRWQSARDVMLELKWIAEQGPRRGPFRGRAMAAAAAAVLAALVIYALSLPRPSALRISAHVGLPMAEGLTLTDAALAGPVAISPDGRRLVFAAAHGSGEPLLWVRALDSLAAQPLTGSNGGAYPFWSPDGRWVGFFAQRKLKKVQAGGGAPQILGEAILPRGGTWNRDGMIVFSAGAGRELYQVSSQGGDSIRLPPDGINAERYWPSFLPGGRQFLYFGRPQHYGVYVASLDTSAAKLLLPGYVGAVYADPGHLLGLVGPARGAPAGLVTAQRFNARRAELSGEAVPIAEGVQYYSSLGMGAFSASNNGTLLYTTSMSATTQLLWFDRRGNQVSDQSQTAPFGQPSLSSNGRVIAVERVDPVTQDEDLWLVDTARDVVSRLTSDPGIDFMPVLAPDADRVVFASARSGPPNLFHKKSNAPPGDEERLVASPYNSQPTDWSPDGQFVIYASLNPKTQWDLWRLPMSGDEQDRQPLPVVQTEFNEHLGRLSPNGRWLAYVSDESGVNEVYVRAFPESQVVTRVSTNGGTEPRWRADGNELYYLGAGRTLMAVSVRSGARFDITAPRALFVIRTGPARSGTGYDVSYAVSGDGERFLVSVGSEESHAQRLRILINWPSALANR